MKTSDQYILDDHTFLHIPRIIVKFVYKEEERRFDSNELILYVTDKTWIDDFLEVGFSIDECLNFIPKKTRHTLDFWCRNINKYFDDKLDAIHDINIFKDTGMLIYRPKR